MLTLITQPNPVLTTPAHEVSPDEISSVKIQTLVDEMIPMMYGHEGIGLAAPQVNHSLRICIIGKDAVKLDKKTTLPHEDLVLINPYWTRVSKKTNSDTEGCLSIPGLYGRVKRYSEIEVRALDRNGNKLSFIAKGFFARVIQHEIDHLDGVLFTSKATDIRTIEKD